MEAILSPVPYDLDFLAQNACVGLPAERFDACPVPGCAARKHLLDPVCEDCLAAEMEQMR